MTRALAGAMVAILERARPSAKEVEEAEGGASVPSLVPPSFCPVCIYPPTHHPSLIWNNPPPQHTAAQAAGASSATPDPGPGRGLIHLACPSSPAALPLPGRAPTPAAALAVHVFSDPAAAAAFLVSAEAAEARAAHHSESGVMLFVLSLLMTRGVARVKGEMDDVGNALTGRFGHCTQEVRAWFVVVRWLAGLGGGID